MKTEYSVEEVQAMAAEISDYGGTQAGLMLTAYADLLERIKAGEGAVPAVCIPFGHGNVVVTTGKHGGVPCVYLAPASMPGVVGESAARENLPRDKRVPGESILTFPTAEQAAIVAAALCGKSVHPPAQAAQAFALPKSFVDRATSSDESEPQVMGAGHLVQFTTAQVDWLMTFNARLIVNGLHPEDARMWMRATDQWDFDADPVAEADSTWQDFLANPDDDGPFDPTPTAEPVMRGETK